jgi:heat shock protein HslJ
MKAMTKIGLILLVMLTGCSNPIWQADFPEPIQILYVGPKMVPCVNPLRNNLCLQVKQNTEDPWKLYEGEVMGLSFEPGYIYELEVQANAENEPDFSGPDIQWVMYRLVNKVPATEINLADKDLLGRTWSLQQFGDPQKLTVVLTDTVPTLIFQSNGQATGTTGCNQFTSSYQHTDDWIRFDALSSTKTMCPQPPGSTEQEQMIFTILQQAERIELTGDKLQIFSTGDDKVLIYVQ